MCNYKQKSSVSKSEQTSSYQINSELYDSFYAKIILTHMVGEIKGFSLKEKFNFLEDGVDFPFCNNIYECI